VPVAALIAVVGLAVAGRIGIRQEPSTRITDAAESKAPVPPAGDSTPTVVRRHETGTDGLMGRIPFNLPPDDVAGPRVNRFTIDDVRPGRTTLDTTPPWVRGLGTFSGDPAHPRER
jgi:hypothetical protein